MSFFSQPWGQARGSLYHKQQGNTTEARNYLIKALEIFERLGTLIVGATIHFLYVGQPERERPC